MPRARRIAAVLLSTGLVMTVVGPLLSGMRWIDGMRW